MINSYFFPSCNSCNIMNIQRESWIAHYWISVLSLINIISLCSIPKILPIKITNICIILDRRCLYLILTHHTSIPQFWIPYVCLILKVLSCLFFSIVVSTSPELVIFLYLIDILLILFILSLIMHWILISQITFSSLIWFSYLRCILTWLNLLKSNHRLCSEWISSRSCVICYILKVKFIVLWADHRLSYLHLSWISPAFCSSMRIVLDDISNWVLVGSSDSC